jgi:hypothetical protein
MAGLTEVKSYISFRCDTGEVKDGRAIYKTINLQGVDGKSDAEDFAAVCGRVGGLLQWVVELLTLNTTSAIDL